MNASEIELSRVDAECLTQMPGDGSIGVNQVAPMARAFLHLHGILTAPLPDDLAAIEARAEALRDWTETRMPDGERLRGLEIARAANMIDDAKVDVPRLLAGMRAQAATIRERDAEVARLDRLAKAERAYRVCHRPYDYANDDAVSRDAADRDFAAATAELLAAGGVP